MYNIKSLRSKLEQLKGQQDYLKKKLKQREKDVLQKKKEVSRCEKAIIIFNDAAQKTQQQLEIHISGLVSMALSGVFPQDPYELQVDFIQRRGKTECDLWFARQGSIVSPLAASGYGAVDVAAFALRVASWAISLEKPRNVLFLDEPFKHLKGEEDNERAIQMVKEISHSLNLQIIMVSDERASKESIIAGADAVFEVKKKGKTSTVTKHKGNE